MLMPALPPNPPAIEQHQECREIKVPSKEIVHPSNKDKAVIRTRGNTRNRVESVVHPNFAATLTEIHPNNGTTSVATMRPVDRMQKNGDIYTKYTGNSRSGKKDIIGRFSDKNEKESEKTSLETDFSISIESLRQAVINRDLKAQEAIRTAALKQGAKNGRKAEEIHSAFEEAVSNILMELNGAKQEVVDGPSEGRKPSKKEKTLELIKRITTNLRRNDNKLDGLTFAEAVLEELRQEIYRDEELMTWVLAEDVDNIVEKVIELTTSMKDNREKKITARRRTEKAPAKVRKTATIKPQIAPTRTQIIEGYINEDECEAIDAELQEIMEKVSKFEKLVYESRGYNY